jgi:hypothetical protein
MECEDLSRVVREMTRRPDSRLLFIDRTLVHFTVPCNDTSVSKTVFLAWLLREVCSFRDAEYYGKYTLKTALALRKARSRPSLLSSQQPPPYVIPVVNVIINFLFFGIPWTYFAHVKRSSEYRGRLASVQRNWDNYVERLVREYSHFLLIVSLSFIVPFYAFHTAPFYLKGDRSTFVSPMLRYILVLQCLLCL